MSEVRYGVGRMAAARRNNGSATVGSVAASAFPADSEYKYFFEKNNPGKKIRNMFFVFIPKVTIRQKKTETLLAAIYSRTQVSPCAP